MTIHCIHRGETFSIPKFCLKIFYRNFLLCISPPPCGGQTASWLLEERGGRCVGPAFVSVKLLEISPLHHPGQLARPDSNLHIAKDPQLQDYFDPETNCRDLIYLQHFISLHLHGAWEPWSQCGLQRRCPEREWAIEPNEADCFLQLRCSRVLLGSSRMDCRRADWQVLVTG